LKSVSLWLNSSTSICYAYVVIDDCTCWLPPVGITDTPQSRHSVTLTYP
jgi:hypothetical protein